MSTFLTSIRERIERQKHEVVARHSLIIRRHLVQLFRDANKVEPSITGVTVGNGAAVVKGVYSVDYGDGSALAGSRRGYEYTANDKIIHSEVESLLTAVHEYSQYIMEMGYISDITTKDL